MLSRQAAPRPFDCQSGSRAPLCDSRSVRNLPTGCTGNGDNAAIMVKSLSTVSWPLLALIGATSTMSMASKPNSLDDPVAAAREFIAEHEKTVRPLEYAASLAWWNANVSGQRRGFQGQGRGPEPARRRALRPWKFRPAQDDQGSLDRRPTTRSPDRGALSALSGEAGRSRAAPPDHGQGQRHREGLQRAIAPT